MHKTEPVNFLTEISNFIFTDKYARYNELMGRRETWKECVDRVEKMHIDKFRKTLTKEDTDEIVRAFDLVRDKRVVPSMRSMQFGGKAVLTHNPRLFNCAVRHIDSPRAFSEVFYLLLCGCGVGFGVTHHFINRLPILVGPEDKTGSVITYTIQDTIEGWADSVEALLNCYFRNTAYSGRKIVFDYSKIRPEGAPIKTGGGKAPGYKGLKSAHKKIKLFLDHLIEEQGQTRLKPVNAYDILLHCADAVLSGGIRRSATCAIFDKSDEEMMNSKVGFSVTKYLHFSKNAKGTYDGIVYVDGRWGGRKNYRYEVTLKEYEYNQLQEKKIISWHHIEPQRARANNSVLLLRDKTTREEFIKINELTRQFGEPGFVFASDPWQLFNPCFDRNTRISTSNGLVKIGDLYKQQTDLTVAADCRIGKGDQYFQKDYGCKFLPATKVALTQENATIYRVTTEHGNTLCVTNNHEFITPTGRKQLHELVTGDTILLQSGTGGFGVGGDYATGLLLGLVVGDGTFSQGSAKLSIWEDDFDNLETILSLLHSKTCSIKNKTHFALEQYATATRGFSNKACKVVTSTRLYKHFIQVGILEPETCKQCVPEYIWQGSRETIRGYLQGIIFTDGSVNLKCANKGSVATLNIEIAQSNEQLLQEIQVLLNNFGIVSRLYKLHDEQMYLLPDGRGGSKDYPCKAAFRLSINRPNSIKLLREIGLFGRKKQLLKDLLDVRGYDCNKPERYITKIKDIKFSHTDDVFCFTQKATNSTVTNGLAVGQCFEVGFRPITVDGVCGVQMCNLTSCNGAKIKTRQDFMQAVWSATVIGTLQATYTNFKYLSQTAKQLTEDEALLGVSITGLLDNPAILLDPGLQYEAAELAKKVNAEWAAKLGIKTAARITVIKPEGTSSLVLESASGIHPHHARQYFRRVQTNKHDPVYRFFKKQNPHMCEESVWSANKTDDVITFPITVAEGAVVKADLSALQHLEIIKRSQLNWVAPGTNRSNAGVTHNVSCTVIVDEHEWQDVFNYLYDNKHCFSAVSLLPKCGDKLFEQAPNEAITTPEDTAKWEHIVNNYKPVNYRDLVEDEDTTTLADTAGCAGGRCEVV